MLDLLERLGFVASHHSSSLPGDRADVGVVMPGPTTDTSATIRLLLHTAAARRVVVMAFGPAQNDALVTAAIAGADGWLAPGMSDEAIRRTLHAVIDGESGFGRNDVSHLLVALRRDPGRTVVRRDGEIAHLTPREHEMYLELAQGMSVRAIAKLLMLSEATIRWHVAQLNKKLNGNTFPPAPSTGSVRKARYGRAGGDAQFLGVSSGPPCAVKHGRAGRAMSAVRLPEAGSAGPDTRGSGNTGPGTTRSGNTGAGTGTTGSGTTSGGSGNAARWAAVPQSERRVARLVAQGLTNQKVADALVLSKHTVDSHLKRIFVKLGVRSRVELTRLVLSLDEES